MEALLKLLEFVFAKVEVIWKGSTDVQVVKILDACLNDPEYKKRSFDELLHQTALYDEKPDELRAILIRIGARRFRGADETEFWGYPNRNSSEKSVTAFRGKTKRRNFFVLYLLFLILLAATWTVLFAVSPDYRERMQTMKEELSRMAENLFSPSTESATGDLSDPTIVMASYKPLFCEVAFHSLSKISQHLGELEDRGEYLVALSNNDHYAVTFSPSEPENIQSILNSIRSMGEGTPDITLSELTRAYPQATSGWTVISSVEACD